MLRRKDTALWPMTRPARATHSTIGIDSMADRLIADESILSDLNVFSRLKKGIDRFKLAARIWGIARF